MTHQSFDELSEQHRLAFEAMEADPNYKTAKAYVMATDAFRAAARPKEQPPE